MHKSSSLKYISVGVPQEDFYTLLDQIVLLASQRRQLIVRYLNDVAATSKERTFHPGSPSSDSQTTTSPDDVELGLVSYVRPEDGRTFTIDMKKLRGLCKPVMIAVAGCAGSGKTTLTAAVCEALSSGLIGSGFLFAKHHDGAHHGDSPSPDNSSDSPPTAIEAVEEKHREQLLLHESKKRVNVVSVPLDGYHKTREELAAMPDPETAFQRRGAPFTFNPILYLNDLRKLVTTASASFPAFAHEKKDPEYDAINVNCLCDWKRALLSICPITPVETDEDMARINQVLNGGEEAEGKEMEMIREEVEMDAEKLKWEGMVEGEGAALLPAAQGHLTTAVLTTDDVVVDGGTRNNANTNTTTSEAPPPSNAYTMLDELRYTQDLFDIITNAPEVVIVEGIYTLFNGVQPDDSPVPPVTSQREVQSWAAASAATPDAGEIVSVEINEEANDVCCGSGGAEAGIVSSSIQPPATREYYYDLRVFVQCPLEVATERLTLRHMAAWGISRSEAYERASGSDLDNGHIILQTMAQADLILGYSEKVVKLYSKLYR